MADEKPRIGDSATVGMETFRVPRVFLSVMDAVKDGNGRDVRPIYLSNDGEIGGRVVGIVHDLTPEGYEVLCEACMAYNDRRNADG